MNILIILEVNSITNFRPSLSINVLIPLIELVLVKFDECDESLMMLSCVDVDITM